MNRRVMGLLCLTVFVTLAFDAAAGTKRILLLGDSWTGLMASFGSFTQPLADAGLSRYEVAPDTAIGGTKAHDWATNANIYGTPGLDRITQALTSNPTIDIIHISLGGNDFLGSAKPILTAEQLSALWDTITGDIHTVILHIRSIRPSARIAVCGYDFLNRDLNGWTAIQTNQKLVELSQRVLAMCQSTPNCVYIHNFGLMQYAFGYPGVYQPGQVPLPGGAPNYTPFPGGDVNYTSPPLSMLDPIHLSQQGYVYLAERCVQQVYAAWLTDFPTVVGITPMGLSTTSEGVVSFGVTFSRSVTGIDPSDFTLSTTGSIVGAEIVGVDGLGANYVVRVRRGTGDGTIAVQLNDDDTITDTNGSVLGGPGAGNGGSALSGPITVDEALPLPLLAWPIAVVLLCAGIAVGRGCRIRESA